MREVLRRRPVLGRLVIAAVGLSLLSLASWQLSRAVGPVFPERPAWDLGSAGPWVASYARAIAAGSWGAARSCFALSVLLLVLDTVYRAVERHRRGARSSHQVS